MPYGRIGAVPGPSRTTDRIGYQYVVMIAAMVSPAVWSERDES
jgi:hypothetical protein